MRADGDAERIRELKALPDRFLDNSIVLTGQELSEHNGVIWTVPEREARDNSFRGTFSQNGFAVCIITREGDTLVAPARYRYTEEGTGGATINMERSAIGELIEAGYQEKNGPRVPLTTSDSPVDTEVATRWREILELNLGILNDEPINYGYATEHEPSASDMDKPDLLA